MSNVLIVFNNPELSKLVKINLLKNINVNIYEKNNSEEALDLIEIIESFDLIICHDFSGNKNFCNEIGNYLSNNYRPIQMLAITNSEIKYENCKKIGYDCDWSVITQEATLELHKKGILATDLPEYVPVSINYFKDLIEGEMKAAIYIRLKKADEEFQFLKRVHEGEKFDSADLKRYTDSGLKELYIHRSQYKDFAISVTEGLVNKLLIPNISSADRHELNVKSYQITNDLMMSLGVDEAAIRLVESSIMSMERSLGENNSIAAFLKLLKANENSYSYSHSYLSCFLLHKVVESFEWYSQMVKEKLTYIAYFHDMALNDDEMSKIHDSKQLLISNFSTKEKNKINNHAIEAAKVIDQFPEVPMGVSSIIREHHGSKNGYGFPDGLSYSIAPLSMMFVVVEHFVSLFLELTDKTSKEAIRNILNQLKLIYDKSTYAQTLQALEKLTLV